MEGSEASESMVMLLVVVRSVLVSSGEIKSDRLEGSIVFGMGASTSAMAG